MKTAIYLRVSSNEQAKHGFSIGAQEDNLHSLIKIKGWELCGIYIDDGISGKNINDRPELNRLIDDVKQGKVENVLVYRIDRLTRSTKDLITLMELFNDNNCAFNSLTESIDTTTPAGRFFIKIIGIFAEFERESIIERVSVALEKKVKDGYILPNYGAISYGYSREIGNREIAISDKEAQIVKEIYSMYLHKHMTFNAIAKELNMRGVPSSTNITWSGSGVSHILTNPIYIGKVRYSVRDEKKYFETEGKHEAIIPEKIFYDVQNKMEKLKKTIRKRPREDNYFCGTLMCAVCGSKMTTHGQYKFYGGEERYYGSYSCLEKKDKGCKSGYIAHNSVESAFKDYIDGYADFEIEPELINANRELEQDIFEKRSEYEAFLAKLVKKEKDIVRLYVNEKIDFEEYHNMLDVIRTEKKAYADKIAELKNTAPLNDKINKEDIISSLRENWEYLTKMERMQFLQTYIEAIYAQREPDTKQVLIKRIEFYKR